MTSFGDAVERQIPRLMRYARVLTRSPDEAEDLVQEALVRALSKQHLWQEGTDLRAWLFTILHNEYVNGVKKSVRRQGTAVEVRDSLRASDRADASVENVYLQLAMSLLHPDQREVIELVGLDGLAYEQVALVLDVPVGTVRSRLSRGRDLLRMLLDGVAKGEPGYTGETLRSLAAPKPAVKGRTNGHAPLPEPVIDEWPEEFGDEC